jgi:hypothetical protein
MTRSDHALTLSLPRPAGDAMIPVVRLDGTDWHAA